MPAWLTLSLPDLNDYLVGAQVTALNSAALAAGQSDRFTKIMTDMVIAEGTNLYYTTARAKADALAAALTGFSNSTGGNVTSGDTILSALGRLENRCALNDAKLTGSDRVKIDGSLAMTGALTFTGSTNAGVVLSNLTDTQRAALSALPGMIIYNTTLSQFEVYNGAWEVLSIGGGTSWFNGAGAPASSLGANGDYYLDTATGNVYLKTSGAWAIVYAPTTAAIPTSGGTFTGTVTFANGLTPAINWGNGWSTTVDSANFAINSSNASGAEAVNFAVISSSQIDLSVANGNINVNQNTYGYQVAGVKVVGAQQSHIVHDASGAANQTTVNAILTALEAHGLVHN